MKPDSYGLTFHHVGIALRNEAQARAFLAGLGYSIGPVVFDPEQKVRVGLCRTEGHPPLEIVLAGDESGPISNMLKRQDSVIYHFCYVTASADRSLAAMAADGLTVVTVSEAKPAILFSGLPVSFHYVGGFGLIELIHSTHSFE